VWQRQCRFTHESEEMFNTPVYSYFLCRNECRMKLALRLCNCIPHFYRSTTKRGEQLPICGFEGFKCLEKIKEEIISLKSNNFEIKCNCLANCDDSNFFVQTYVSQRIGNYQIKNGIISCFLFSRIQEYGFWAQIYNGALMITRKCN